MPASIALFQTLRNSKSLFMGISLMMLCTQYAIPLEPVPITLQTVGVLLIGLTYSRKLAVQTMAGYLGLGAMGLPVFSHFTGGLSVLMGPTGGYLLGFLAAVYVMASLREKFSKESWLFFAGLALLGNIMIIGCGVLWLSKFVGIQQAFSLGILPFVMSGLLKAALLSSVLYGTKKLKIEF